MNKKSIKHMIFSNFPEDIQESNFAQEYRECYGETPNDSKLESFICESLESEITFERDNLDLPLPEEIITFGTLQLWDGIHFGYRETRAANINELLYSNNDYCRWYLNSFGEFCSDEAHHDGTNHYSHRMWHPDTSEEMKEQVLNFVYNKDPRAMSYIKRYTVRLGDIIGDVYGWNFGHRPQCTLSNSLEYA